MNKSIILVIIIGIIAVSGISYYITNSNIVIDKDPTIDSFKIGIVSWVTNEQFENNIIEFKKYVQLDDHFNDNNLQFIERISYADKSKHQEIVQEFIDEKVDLIFTQTTSGTLAVKEMTQNIPIVFSVVTYPVESGIIDDLKQSGNNIVGTRNYIPIEEQFDFFLELYQANKVGFIHRENEPNSIIQINEAIEYGNKHGIEIIDISATSLENLENKINENISNVDALYQACDTLVQSGGEGIAIRIATENNKPTFSCNLDGVRQGALVGGVANFSDIGKKTGSMAHKILEGKNISNMETKGPDSAYKIINLKTAESLGIEISKELEYSVREVVR